jgi:superfamily II DNA helicase RecQ
MSANVIIDRIMHVVYPPTRPADECALAQSVKHARLVASRTIDDACSAAKTLVMPGKARNAARDMAGIRAAFVSGEQFAAATFVLRAQPGAHSVVILPTGGGKTLIFLLAAALERVQSAVTPVRTTIFLVPFVALAVDMVARCQARCIIVRMLRDMTPTEKDTSMLVVTVEQLQRPKYETVVGRLASQNRLARIVFDEAHTLVTASEYRQIMAGVAHTLRPDDAKKAKVPVLLLSGTLPVFMLPDVLHRAGLL